MNAYKLLAPMAPDMPIKSVVRNDGAAIPLTLENRDCVKFLEDWKNGAEVLDENGAAFAYTYEKAVGLGLEE